MNSSFVRRLSLAKILICFFVSTSIVGCKNPLGEEDTRDSSFAPGGGGTTGGGGDNTNDETPPGNPSALNLSATWVTGANPVSSPIFTWTNPSDEDFKEAQVALGISLGGEEIVPFAVSSGGTSHTFNNIGLTECSTTYYPSVKAVDESGNQSTAVSFTVGFKYDNSNPSAVAAVNIPANNASPSQAPTVNWIGGLGSDNCGIDHYEIAIGYDDEADGFDAGDVDNVISWSNVPGGSSTTSYQIQDSVDGFSFSATFGRQYFTSVRVVDEAGLSSTVTSSSGWYTFHPTQFTSLEIWLDGSDSSTHFQDAGCSTTPATNALDPVGCWRDKSGQLNHAIQAGGNTPRVGVTGIDFDGNDDVLSIAGKNYVFTSDLTLFFLYEADIQSTAGGSCCRPIVSFLTGSTGFFPWLALTRGDYGPNNNLFHGWNGAPMAPLATTPGDQFIVSATHDGTGGLWNSYSSGLARVVNEPLVSYTGTPFNVGGDASNAARRIHGEIFEVIAIDAILGTTDRQKMEGYLACKYDARDTLDAGHPYYDLVGANKTGCP